MKDYFTNVVIASIISALSSVIFSSTKFEKYIKYIASLIAAVIILMPIGKLANKNYDMPLKYANTDDIKNEGEELMYSFLEESGKEALENYFFNCVFSNFGIKPISISIDIESTDDGMKILGGKAKLKEEDRSLTEDVKKYLSEISGAIPWTVS